MRTAPNLGAFALASLIPVAAAITAAGSTPSSSSSSTLGLSVDGHSGTYAVTLNGAPFFQGGAPRVDGQALVISSSPMVEDTGVDGIGSFHSQSLKWKNSAGVDLLETTWRTYPEDAGALVFEQRFLTDIGAAPAPSGGSAAYARTLFPAFSLSTSAAAQLPCASYHGVFPRLQTTTVSKYAASHQGGAPLIIWNASDDTLPMVTLSPLGQPKAQHFDSLDGFIGAGIKSTVQSIPAGHVQRFLMSAGTGISDGMLAWGDRLLQFLGTKRIDNRYRDAVHGSIGFWTDNGGFYHYSIGANKSLGSNYEEVLTRVHEHHEASGIPFKHWQFDSWFYPKDGGVNPGGGGGAVTNWTAMSSVFPHGMAYIQSKLKMPMVMHNRQWSTHSDYIKNEPFKWYISKKAAVPQDPQAFFTWFFQQQPNWGLSMYEQDWMCTEYDEVEALQQNITLGDLWLEGMATGATSGGLTVQYCMPYPHDVLAAAALPAVTNARATGDYFHDGGFNWAIGATSLFYHSIGILPFKDGFYSSSAKQVGGQTEGPEMHPDREAIMALLSTAMVGPMDGYGLVNKSRIMSTCRADGLLLKPDVPLRTIDACFRDWTKVVPESCYKYLTWSTVSGSSGSTVETKYFYDDESSSTFSASDLGIADANSWAIMNWYTKDLHPLASDGNTLTGGYEGHVYATLHKVIGQKYYFIGEMDKYVTAAGVRFANVVASNDGLQVTVSGVAGETVQACASGLDLKIVCQDVKFDTSGARTVVLLGSR